MAGDVITRLRSSVASAGTCAGAGAGAGSAGATLAGAVSASASAFAGAGSAAAAASVSKITSGAPTAMTSPGSSMGSMIGMTSAAGRLRSWIVLIESAPAAGATNSNR